MNNTNTIERVKKYSKKTTNKGTWQDGKYIPSSEQKAQYLDTYKSNPCYSMLVSCPLCNTQYIKITESKHILTKKYLLNLKSYEQTKEEIEKNNITDEEEQLKIFNDFKTKNIYNNYLDKIQVKKPQYFENYKLFESIKIIK